MAELNHEKEISPSNGYVMLSVIFLLFLFTLTGFFMFRNPYSFLLLLVVIFLCFGLILVNPNQSRVLLLFGEYKGTVKKNGLFWVNPLYVKNNISLRARNFDSERLKVNDKLGNPVMISTILVWRVLNTYKASFDVDNFENFCPGANRCCR